MERELTLKGILIVLLKKTKLILICMLICGILTVSYGFISMPTADNVTNNAEKYATELRITKAELAQAQQREKALNDYKMNSLYYSIDSYNTANCTIQFLIDTGYKINPNLTYQNPDPTYNVATAYTTLYEFDSDVMLHVVELLGGDIDEKYAAELISVTASGYMVRISVVHSDADTASKIADYIFSATKARVNETVMEHDTMVISNSAVYCIDNVMRARQDAVDQELVNVLNRVVEEKKSLALLQEDRVPEQPSEIFTMRIVKFAVLGLALGIVFGCCIVAGDFIIGDCLSNLSDVARCDFPMLGTLPLNSKKRWFDRWIRKLENDPLLSSEASTAVLTANLDAVAAGKRIALVGTCKRSVLDNLAAKLGESVFAAGNVVEDATAVESLQQADVVLLVEIRGKVLLQKMDQLVKRLKTLDKEIIGIVLG